MVSRAVLVWLLFVPLTHAQTNPALCNWTTSDIDVYFNEGTIAANGFSPSGFREATIDAMATWNEEGQADYDLLFAGITTSNRKSNAIVIRNEDIGGCGDNSAARAFYPLGGSCGAWRPYVIAFMKDSCAPHPTRQWVEHYPNPWHSAGIAGQTGYEGAMTHELGHMLGFDHPVGVDSVMCCPGTPATFLRLFPIDIASTRAVFGNTGRRPHTAWSSTGSSWSAPSILSTSASSSPPALDGNLPSGSGPLRAAFWDPLWRNVAVREGTHALWSSMSSASVPFDVDAGASIANSDFGETMVVWLDDCDGTFACDVEWAWTNGSSWTRGTLETNTHTKAYVEYDRYEDRFVLASISELDARIRLTSANAITAPGWAPWTSTIAIPYRHLGGMVFDGAGNGLLVASVHYGGVKGYIAQFNIGSSGSTYTLSGGQWATLTPSSADTRRPFGIAYDSSTGRVMAAWRDVSSPRHLAVATKFGLSTSVKFSSPTFPISQIVNGANVAYDHVNNRFTAGFSY